MTQESIGSIILSPRSIATGSPVGAALENINTSPLADGSLCYVSGGSGQGEWQLEKTATDAPDGVTIVAPIAGPGRWFIKLLPGAGGGSGGLTGITENTEDVITVTNGGGPVATLTTPNIRMNATSVVMGATTPALGALGASLVVGALAGTALVSGTGATILGPGAGAAKTAFVNGVIIGPNAGAGAVSSMTGGVIIGSLAGTNASGASAVLVGNQAGTAVTGTNAVFLGNQAGTVLTNGVSCVGVGSQAMGGAGTYGSGNVAVGAQAMGGGGGTGADNVALGFQAMGVAFTTASRNICLGAMTTIPSGTTNDYFNIGDYVTGFHAQGATYTGRFGVGVGVNDFSAFAAPNVFQNAGGGTDALPFMEWRHLTTNGANIQWFQGTRDPNGLVTGNAGDFYIRSDGTNSTIYQRQTAGAGTVWVELGVGGNIGVTVNASSAVGVVTDPGINSMQTYVLTSALARTIALPATAAHGARIVVKDGNGAGTTITVSVDGGGNIDFGTSHIIATIGGSATFQWDTTSGQWWVI